MPHKNKYHDRKLHQAVINGYLDKSFLILILFLSLLPVIYMINPEFSLANILVSALMLALLLPFRKDLLYIIRKFPLIRKRLVVILAGTAAIYLCYFWLLYDYDSFPMAFTLFFFGGISYIIILYWFSRAFTPRVYVDFFRHVEFMKQKEQDYYNSLAAKIAKKRRARR